MDEVEGLLADLRRWSGAQRVDEAAQARTRERWMRQQSDEAARFTGVALDLAEQGAPVGIRMAGGRQHHGRLTAVAADFLVLVGPSERPVLLATASVGWIRAAPGRQDRASGSDRPPPLNLRLADALAGLAADRPRVQVVLAGDPEPVTGVLRSVGEDVLTLRLDAGGTLHLHLAAIAEVTALG